MAAWSLAPATQGPPVAAPRGGTAESSQTSTLAADAAASRAHAPESGGARRALDAVDDTAGAGRLLRVIDAVTRQPAVAAEVFVAKNDAVDRWRADRPGSWERAHWAEIVEARATAQLTNAQGLVRLPAFGSRLLVAARAPQKFGVLALYGRAPESEEPVLELHADYSVSARVVDAEGLPVPGVPVGLCNDLLVSLRLRRTEISDAEGRVRLSHLQLYRESVSPRQVALKAQLREAESVIRAHRAEIDAARQRRQRQASAASRAAEQALVRSAVENLRRVAEQKQRAAAELGSLAGTTRWRKPSAADAADATDAEFVLLVVTPQQAPALARFAIHAVPEREIELRVGGLGAVEVVLRGPDGTPLQTPCKVGLRLASSSPASFAVPAEQVESLRKLAALEVSKPLGAHTVWLAPVGAGLLLDAAVRFADDDFDFVQSDLRGPAAGETVTLALDVPDWVTVLRGRLVDAERRPVALDADLMLSGARGRIEGERISIGADGRFELMFKLGEPRPPYALEVRIDNGDRLSGALVPVTALRAGGVHDVGDVVVSELPVLVHGVVVDDVGAPIRRARVSLQQLRANGDRGPRWRDEAGLQVRTDADGRYELRGERRAGRVRVAVRASGHATPDSAEIAFGERRDFSLERFGQLQGGGKGPDWLPRGVLRLELWRNGERVRDDELRVRRGKFGFRVRNLHAGDYTLALALRGAARPLLRVSGLHVGPGQRVVDPRLQGVDLNGRLFRYEVAAFDLSGRALRPASPLLVQLTDANGARQTIGYPWRGNRVEFVATDPVVDVVAMSNGHAPRQQRLFPGEARIVLSARQPLDVELPGLRAMVGADRRVRVSLVYAGDTGLPMSDFEAIDQRTGKTRGFARAALGKSSGAWLGDSDRVRVRLMLEGRYEVVCRFYVEGVRRPVSRSVGVIDAVLSGDEVALATLTPDARLVEQALAELALAANAALQQR